MLRFLRRQEYIASTRAVCLPSLPCRPSKSDPGEPEELGRLADARTSFVGISQGLELIVVTETGPLDGLGSTWACCGLSIDQKRRAVLPTLCEGTICTWSSIARRDNPIQSPFLRS